VRESKRDPAERCSEGRVKKDDANKRKKAGAFALRA
jgi:hypothetical protein